MTKSTFRLKQCNRAREADFQVGGGGGANANALA